MDKCFSRASLLRFSSGLQVTFVDEINIDEQARHFSIGVINNRTYDTTRDNLRNAVALRP